MRKYINERSFQYCFNMGLSETETIKEPHICKHVLAEAASKLIVTSASRPITTTTTPRPVNLKYSFIVCKIGVKPKAKTQFAPEFGDLSACWQLLAALQNLMIRKVTVGVPCGPVASQLDVRTPLPGALSVLHNT
jgi:hypothetical protein